MLTDRLGDHVGPSLLSDVLPRLGDRVTFKTSNDELITATVVDVTHAVHFAQKAKAEPSDIRLYVHLDLDAGDF